MKVITRIESHDGSTYELKHDSLRRARAAVQSLSDCRVTIEGPGFRESYGRARGPGLRLVQQEHTAWVAA